jgi:hypothetical protein
VQTVEEDGDRRLTLPGPRGEAMVRIRFEFPAENEFPEENVEHNVTDEWFELLQAAAAVRGLSWQEFLWEWIDEGCTEVLLMDTAEIQALRAWFRAHETH